MRGIPGKISLYLLVLGLMAAGINHFVHPHFYRRLMPDYMPLPMIMVYLSGLAECLLGALLLPQRTRNLAATLTAVMLLLFLSVHIDMLLRSYREPGYPLAPSRAWLRLLLQPVLIIWALSVRPKYLGQRKQRD